ncbi:WXG100 family type VII secretion target [Nocardia amikacinitolerans]|uniref:WXG100 family type VII secretion target n=1 Tax=Nocardia amikacinitolerans TaxID=756689 RepID=UPI0020A26DC8|nr:WXG100 family type VII secretion target [Nocardia amikacinitolerans]MCP2289127.1 WXG100 family type VII secretion target [Nocardia amikacinitolerans]
MSNEFSVDLDDLDEATAKIEGYQRYMADGLAELDRRVASVLASNWSGAVADAYSAAHRDWSVGVTDVREGLTALQATARLAHGSYMAAKAANALMFGRGK